jgi:hypothetical protein
VTVDGGATINVFDPAERSLGKFGATYTADGVVSYTSGPETADHNGLEVVDFRGAAFQPRSTGVRIFDCRTQRNWQGIIIRGSDCEISRTRIAASRDFGLWIMRDAGNTQTFGNHIYGARVACYYAGNSWRSVEDTFADAPIGLWIANYNDGPRITQVLFHHNWGKDIHIQANRTTISDSTINAALKRTETAFSETVHLPYDTTPRTFSEDGNASVVIDSSTGGGDDVSFTNSQCTFTDYQSGTPANDAKDLFVLASGCDRGNFDNIRISDGDGLNGNRLWVVTNAVSGLRIRAELTYTPNAADRLLVFSSADATNVEALDIEIRGPGLDTANPGNNIDLDDGWTGSIKLINTTTGAESSISEGAAL